LLDRDLWEKIPDGAQSEVLRQAEMMVKGTVAISDGANQRAATAMNVFGAGAIALFAAAAALIASKFGFFVNLRSGGWRSAFSLRLGCARARSLR